jgi:hypothetical protein
MKNEMVLDGYGVVELSHNDFLAIDGGLPKPVQWFLDYCGGKVVDSLWEGFKDACQNGHKADPGSKCMHTALH